MRSEQSKQVQGDPTRVIKVEEAPSFGPGGITPGNPDNFIMTGRSEDILATLRQRGWSEEAIQAFKQGKTISRNVAKVRVSPDVVITAGTDESY